MATALQILAPDLDAMTSFLSDAVAQDIHLVAIKPDTGDVRGTWFGNDAPAAAGWANAQNAGGANVYWTVNVTRRGFNGKPKKTDIAGARFLHVDVDPPKDGSAFDREVIVAKLDGMRHPPCLVIDSGNGVQAFWRLEEPLQNQEAVEALNQRLAQFVGGDSCHNIDRLMRLPGGINYPDARKAARGRIPAATAILQADTGETVQAEEMHAILPEFVGVASGSRTRRGQVDLRDVEILSLAELGIREDDILARVIRNGDPARRSEAVMKAVGMLVRRGRFEDAQIAGVLLNPEHRVGDHLRDQANPLRSLSRAIGRARANKESDEDAGSTERDGTTRPLITVRAGELHTMATEAEEALIGSAAPFYVRGGAIVRPVVDRLPSASGVPVRVARLLPVQESAMVDHLSRVASWQKYDGRKDTFVRADPPTNVAATILSRDGEWKFARLSGVITTPTMRPDGTILCEPGYDRATSLLLMESPRRPDIPAAPSRNDALAALNKLDALLDDFPFTDAASRAVALSALITPVVRGAMPVAPMHAVTATSPGSGKSYVIDLVSAISAGERAPVLTAGRTEEETEKRLGAAIIEGQALISIDNVNGDLGGDALCQLVERPIVSVRPLGTSKLVKVESRACCFATGNNIRLVGDMTRRVLLCSLDPDVERPELRTFGGDPFATVIADRAAYIAAALVIVRAYAAAGYPGALSPLASFEAWSKLVRSALVWLGQPDPVQTMEKARSEDPVTSTLTTIFSAWHDAVGSAPQTVAQIIGNAEAVNSMGNAANTELREALTEVGQDRFGKLSGKVLGIYLARYAGRIAGGLKLTKGEDKHAKQKVWQIVRADG